jgi:hypothetical protein
LLLCKSGRCGNKQREYKQGSSHGNRERRYRLSI